MNDPKLAKELLKNLPEPELKEMLRVCALITDPLSQELMKRAISVGTVSVPNKVGSE